MRVFSLERIIIFLSVVVVSLALVLPSAPTARAEETSPSGIRNVLLIILDALRADRLGIYGYRRNTSPNLDALARKGIVFQRALVQAGWTRSSIPSMLTSTYPGVHRVYYRDDALPSGLPTLAEVFRANGYFNYAFHNNDMVDATFGFSRGFDIFRKSDDEGIAVLAGLALDGALPKGSSFNPEEAGQLARFLRAARDIRLNLVENYSFENPGSEWIYQREWLEEGNAHTGRRAIRIAKGDKLTPGNFWYLYQEATLRSGYFYLFGAFVKTSNLNGDLRVEIKEKTGGQVIATSALRGNNDWTLLLGVFRPRSRDENFESAVVIRPARLVDFQGGEFWIDDVFIIPFDYFPPLAGREKQRELVELLAGRGIGNTVRNWSFESGAADWEGDPPVGPPGRFDSLSLRALRGGIPEEGCPEVSPRVLLRPDTPYLFGALAETSGLQGRLAIEVEIDGRRCRTDELSGDSDWSLLLGVLPSPASAEPVPARIFPSRVDDYASGEFRVDNVFLFPLTDAPRKELLRPADKLFLYLHFLAPHIPYTAPDSYLRHFRDRESFSREETIPLAERALVDPDRYDAAIRAMDTRLGLLFEKLEDEGILDHTLVVITADHGEGFGEHGLWGHSPDYYHDEFIRVPLILYNPLLFPEPKKINETVQASVDILPLLANLLELTLPEGMEFQGRSPLDPDPVRPQFAFFYDRHGVRKVSDHRWSYVAGDYFLDLEEKTIRAAPQVGEEPGVSVVSFPGGESFLFDSEASLQASEFYRSFSPGDGGRILALFQASRGKTPALFNLESDPGEGENVIAGFPGKAAEFEEIIRRRREEDESFRSRSGKVSGDKVRISDELNRRLRALGYLN